VRFPHLNRALIWPQRWRPREDPNGTDVAHYLDTSALVKLVVAEPETAALRAWLSKVNRDPVACDLARTELLRAVRQAAPEHVRQARAVLDSITLTALTTSLLEQAGRLGPTTLHSLDAIHLAAALDLGDDLNSVVTYDDRLAEAARSNGIAVTAPS
jgi:predicted nucleic acid-binding protein